MFLQTAALGKLIWWWLFAGKVDVLGGSQVSYWAIAIVHIRDIKSLV